MYSSFVAALAKSGGGRWTKANRLACRIAIRVRAQLPRDFIIARIGRRRCFAHGSAPPRIAMLDYMDPIFIAGLASRWLHIASAITLLGGMFYALNLARAGALSKSVADGFRAPVLSLVLALLASGLYNLLHKTNTPPGYHMIFGIKALLFLHVAAVSYIATQPGADASKRVRQLTGVVISGFVIVALSAYLRAISI